MSRELTDKEFEALELIVSFGYYNAETLMFEADGEYEESETYDALDTLSSYIKQEDKQ